MDITPPDRPFANAIEDSRRWHAVALRPDDIIISTPPKCGTTWTQGIVSSLMWPEGGEPGTLSARSPWPDARFGPTEAMLEQVEAISHRRFLKSHAPAWALPFSADVRYITVYRNPADALVSWGNHRESMMPEIMRMVNGAAAAIGVDPMPETWEGDWQVLFDEWRDLSNPIMHLASWWDRRHDDNVLLVHYADLYADLEAGMRRIADFLSLDVPEPAWPQVVDRCRMDSMREAARAVQPHRRVGFRDGVDSFYFKGGNGRGVELLPTDLIASVDALASELLTSEAADWLYQGGSSLPA